MRTENLKGRFVARECGMAFDEGDQPVQTVDFPFVEVELAFNEAEQVAGPEMRSELIRAVNLLLTRLVDFRFLRSDAASRAIGRRFIALAWIINPGAFGGVSIAQLAERLGASKQCLSKHCSELSNRFGIENSAQQRGRSGGHRKRLKKKDPPEIVGGGEDEAFEQKNLTKSMTSTSPGSEAGR